MSTDYYTFFISDLSYSEQPLISNQRLDFPVHQWTALIGKSGQGKTTLLKTLLGLKEGLLNKSFLNKSPLPSLSYMPQQDLLLPWRTVLNNVILGSVLRNQTPLPYERAYQILDAVGLKAESHSYPYQLSTGMRQRVALARTLLEDPQLVLLDEPFSAVDLQLRQHLYELTKTVLKGKTVLFVSHDLNEVCQLADHVLVLKGLPALCHKVSDFQRSSPPLNSSPEIYNNLERHNNWQNVAPLWQALYG